MAPHEEQVKLEVTLARECSSVKKKKIKVLVRKVKTHHSVDCGYLRTAEIDTVKPPTVDPLRYGQSLYMDEPHVPDCLYYRTNTFSPPRYGEPINSRQWTNSELPNVMATCTKKPTKSGQRSKLQRLESPFKFAPS